ncbi:MAG: citrate lyase acyl carrier protein [candidate division WOR-3 bacterium]|nr:citrate lyase acyl carrier protein [candidate division WOR-3 bacterium]
MENISITKVGRCGQEDKGDCIVEVYPCDRLKIVIHSVVEKFFKEEIEKTIRDVLKKNGIQNAKISFKDKGALDWVIRARLNCALGRAK